MLKLCERVRAYFEFKSFFFLNLFLNLLSLKESSEIEGRTPVRKVFTDHSSGGNFASGKFHIFVFYFAPHIFPGV